MLRSFPECRSEAAHKREAIKQIGQEHICICFIASGYTLLSFVTMPTRMHWSKAPQQNSPSLSGDQSKQAIGWEEKLRVDSSSTLPATPSSCPSWSW